MAIINLFILGFIIVSVIAALVIGGIITAMVLGLVAEVVRVLRADAAAKAEAEAAEAAEWRRAAIKARAKAYVEASWTRFQATRARVAQQMWSDDEVPVEDRWVLDLITDIALRHWVRRESFETANANLKAAAEKAEAEAVAKTEAEILKKAMERAALQKWKIEAAMRGLGNWAVADGVAADPLEGELAVDRNANKVDDLTDEWTGEAFVDEEDLLVGRKASRFPSDGRWHARKGGDRQDRAKARSKALRAGREAMNNNW